ncbi:MAG TPA: hypothetical protein VJ476_01965 [Rhizomicrobium sp.]|nr:hypothetical protein [Rhizomicrobium sp.]
MKTQIPLAALLALLPIGANAQQTPPVPVTVPPKIIGYVRGPHNMNCMGYVPQDILRQVHVVHAAFTVVVNPDGTAKSAIVQDDSGRQEIASALNTCAMNWLFKPATVDGQPIEGTSTSYQIIQAAPFSN